MESGSFLEVSLCLGYRTEKSWEGSGGVSESGELLIGSAQGGGTAPGRVGTGRAWRGWGSPGSAGRGVSGR